MTQFACVRMAEKKVKVAGRHQTVQVTKLHNTQQMGPGLGSCMSYCEAIVDEIAACKLQSFSNHANDKIDIYGWIC